MTAAELRAWADSVRLQHGSDEVVAEALFDLDLLPVHLLTPADVPALLALVEGGDLEGWRRYREAIDLDARSKELRRVPLYRNFCRGPR